MSPVGSSEIRVVIRPIEAPGSQPELIPAALFKKILDAFLAAVIAADRELHSKSASSLFFISHLGMGSYEFGIVEKRRSLGPGGISAIELLRRCAGRVYRSDYQILLRYQRLLRAFHKIVKALDPDYVVLVHHNGAELPMDGFFCRQVDRVGSVNVGRPQADDVWFSGTTITSFEGRLEELDYRGPVWRGRLLLANSETQLECVFDRSRGEDALNPFGNKNVSITGRAIYTGDSEIPERIEVLKIDELPRSAAAVGIQGSLTPAFLGDLESADWEDGFDYIE
jgi:hypothetical protein